AEKGSDFLFGGEKTSQMATRESRANHIVVSAINADFWRSKYIPIGPFVDEGMIYKSHHIEVPRAVFMMDDQKTPYISVATMNMVVEVDDRTTCAIDVINVDGDFRKLPPEQKDLFLYTPAFGETTRTSADGRTEIILRMLSSEFIPNKPCEAEVIQVRKNAGDSEIEKGTLVLSGTGEGKKFLEQNLAEIGKRIRINVRVPGVQRPIVLMVGGGPIILDEGRVNIDNRKEKIRDSFVNDKHPRTAIGFSRDKKTLFFMTIDGRQPGLSIGANLYWVARYLREHGAWKAMNLDGGGSTTMWVRGEVVNRPSDRGGERTVTNALLLVSTAPIGKPHRIEVFPDKLTLPVRCSAVLNFFAYDANQNPLQVSPEDFVVDVPGGLGTVSEHKIFVAGSQPARGALSVRLKSAPQISYRVPVIIEQPHKIVIKPGVLVMRLKDSVRLNIKVKNKQGKDMAVRNSDFKIEVPECVNIDRETLTIRATRQGSGKIVVSLGGGVEKISATLPVYVEMFKEKILYAFDHLPPTPEGKTTCLYGHRFDTQKTRLSIEKIKKKEGSGACRLDYSMLHGGVTAIYIPINVRIEKPPQEYSIWVYGDGKNGWLRGELVDKDGERFIADFTSGASGVFWRGWRLLRISNSQISPKWTNPGAKMDYPVTFEQLYLAQSRELYKTSGTIILDALTAIYPPGDM
ncbi:phosphodiester glycosidase family protein, partial [Candidatus Sumerlaeota bacterium]|nr:phosphodiester glycosidase family protein [Candidatus Sumerlaeota bacterium]